MAVTMIGSALSVGVPIVGVLDMMRRGSLLFVLLREGRSRSMLIVTIAYLLHVLLGGVH